VETAKVTKELKNLTQDTVDDSVTVQVITLVSAIYLPGSFVGVSCSISIPPGESSNMRPKTLYGMNFFLFNSESSSIIIAQDFWIFIATWLPLTFLTGAIYIFFIWMHARRNDKPFYWPWEKKPKRV